MSWLTNHTIERFIRRLSDRSTRSAFLGVFPLNELPIRVERRPALLVVNTQTSDLSGSHWLCLMLFEDGHGEVFNSFGLPPPTAVAR